MQMQILIDMGKFSLQNMGKIMFQEKKSQNKEHKTASQKETARYKNDSVITESSDGKMITGI